MLHVDMHDIVPFLHFVSMPIELVPLICLIHFIYQTFSARTHFVGLLGWLDYSFVGCRPLVSLIHVNRIVNACSSVNPWCLHPVNNAHQIAGNVSCIPAVH